MPSPRPIITLTTDFGYADGTVGAMIGVIKSLCPESEVIVAAADVPAHDIPRGAWALYQAVPYYPAGSIHIAVVDPGVGSSRRAVAARTANSLLIGPDNGVLSWAVRSSGSADWRSIENPACRLPSRGVTFDGRDLFAPTAAALAAGMIYEEIGPEVHDAVLLEWPEPKRRGREISGEVLVVDTFGNLITNIPTEIAKSALGSQDLVAVMPGGQRARLVSSYADVTSDFGMVTNGSGLLEVAAHGKSAAGMSGLSRGAMIVITAGEN